MIVAPRCVYLPHARPWVASHVRCVMCCGIDATRTPEKIAQPCWGKLYPIRNHVVQGPSLYLCKGCVCPFDVVYLAMIFPLFSKISLSAQPHYRCTHPRGPNIISKSCPVFVSPIWLTRGRPALNLLNTSTQTNMMFSLTHSTISCPLRQLENPPRGHR